MLDFDYQAETRILFGKDKIKGIAGEIKKYSARVLLVYGKGSIKTNGIHQELVSILNENKISFNELSGIEPNPKISSVRQGIALCRVHELDFILAVGGGSVIDCAKAIACGVYSEKDPWDFFIKKSEIIKALPIGVILTLSATGSESNGFSVISNKDTEEKLGIGHDILKPKFSILDPSYTFTVSSKQSAYGVVDIYSHLLEQYFSPEKGTFLQDRLAESLMKTCIHYGAKVLTKPNNYEFRAQLMWASSLSLNGLLSCGKTGDWSTHFIEHVVSAVYDIAHGLGLAIITPYWMEYVLGAKDSGKFADYGRNVFSLQGQDDAAIGRDAIEQTKAFFKSLGLPSRLKDVGVEEGSLGQMAKKATKFGSIGSYSKLDTNDVYEILKTAY